MSRHFLRKNLKHYLHRFAPLADEAAPTTAWYEVGVPVVAYQPLGAASYADSKINLANPGTDNAVDGVAPTWSAVTGWSFNGTTQYVTSIIPGVDGTWSMFIRFANGGTSSVFRALAGMANPAGVTSRFNIYSSSTTPGLSFQNGSNGSIVYVGSNSAGGVIGFAGKSTYFNGGALTDIPAGTGSNPAAIYIGGSFYNGNLTSPFDGDILALGIWDSTPPPAQASEISTKMLAL